MSKSKRLKLLSMAICIFLQTLSVAPTWTVNSDYPKPKDDIAVKGDVYVDKNVFVDKSLDVESTLNVDNTSKLK